MRVLITGSKGQVGLCLTKQLNGCAEIIAVDRDELDITDKEAINTFVTTFKPDVIINAAAHTAVDRAEEEVQLSHEINCLGPKYLANAAESIDAAFLHISTDYVFDGEGEGLYSEKDEPNPQSVYGKTKLAGEKAVAEACKKHIILRTAWVFSEHGNNFVKTMLRVGQERSQLNIVSDQFGGPTYANDIASCLIRMAYKIHKQEKVAYGTYHYSGMPHVSWYEFAKAIFDIADNYSLIKEKPTLTPITAEQYPTPAKRPRNSKLDCSKVYSEFQVEPSDWQSALNNIRDFVQSNESH